MISDALQLRKTLKVVDHLKNHASGFTYDDENGANIGIAEQNAWEVYVKVHRDAKPFRTKGWPYLAKMEQLVPSQAKGAHVFRPSQAVAPTDPLDVDSQHGDMPPSPDAPFSPSVWDMEKPDYQGGDDDGDDEEREKEKEPEEQRSSVRLILLFFLISFSARADYYQVSHSYWHGP